MSLDRLRPNEREVLYAPDRRMNAYYYSFDPTGQPAIDAILSAVAHAGKGYHHTESWRDDGEWSRWGEGRSVVDVIQAAANEAALALLDAAAERDALRAERDALAEKVEDLECVLAGAGVCVECYANGWHKLDCSRRRTARALDEETDHA